MRDDPLALLAAFALCVTGAACDPTIPQCPEPRVGPASPEYLGVQVGSSNDADDAPPPDITRSDRFRDVRPGLRSAVVRPPEECFEDGPPVPGMPPRLKGACAPWVEELERDLFAGGFAVSPSDQLLAIERQKNRSSVAAAKELHADVVFVFDRLEVVDFRGVEGLAQRFRYYASDAHGYDLGPRDLDQATRTDIESFIASIVGAAPPMETTMISASAVVVESGEEIWRYRRNVVVPLGKSRDVRFLFGRYGQTAWSSVGPTADPAAGLFAAITPTVGAAGIQGEHALASTLSMDAPYEGERYRLMRSGAIDFVRAFQGGP